MMDVGLPPITVRPTVLADTLIAERRRVLVQTREQLTLRLERRRRTLERALHDGAQQQLLALRMEILRVGHELDTPPNVDGDATLTAAIDVASLVNRVDLAVDELVRLASGEPPAALESGSLADALHQLVQITGLEAEVYVPTNLHIDPSGAEVVAFVVSEALANVQQHSAASTCTVRVAPTRDGVRVDIADNGRGGAVAVPGRGIDGLRRRAENIGGTLEISSDCAGTLVRLHLPHPPEPVRQPVETPTTIPSARDELRLLLGDHLLQLWFWSDPLGWVDEAGRVPESSTSTESQDDEMNCRSEPVRFRMLDGHRLFALVLTTATAHAVRKACVRAFPQLVDARERAHAAIVTNRLDRDHERVELRATSFEDALRRRLIDRPREELLAARALLVQGASRPDPPRAGLLDEAARRVALATDSLRDIVRRLRVSDGDWDSSPDLSNALARIAHRARVHIDLRADDIEDERAANLIERVTEEVLLDAPPGADIAVRVRSQLRSAALSVTLDRLPSPVATALLEELATASGSTLAFKPGRDGIRLLMETPCRT